MAKTKTESVKNEGAALRKVRPLLDKLAPEEVHEPLIPVDRLVGEARTLFKVAEPHLELLAKIGLERRLVSSLPVRADALAASQSLYLASRSARRSEEEVALEGEGHALRSDMIADLRYAARGDHDVQAQLDVVREGSGLDDLVGDLRALRALFQGHEQALRRASVDAKKKGARAHAVAHRLEQLVAARRAGSDDEGAEKALRDRAATLLEQAMSEIRAAGVYLFRLKPAVQAKYRSPYHALKRQQAKRRRAQEAAPDPA